MPYTIRSYPHRSGLGTGSCRKVCLDRQGRNGCGGWRRIQHARLHLGRPHGGAILLPFSTACRVRLPSFWTQGCRSCAIRFRPLRPHQLRYGRVCFVFCRRGYFPQLATVRPISATHRIRVRTRGRSRLGA